MTTIYRTTVTIAGARSAIERLITVVSGITTHPALQQALSAPVWGDAGALLAIDHRQSANLGERIAEAARKHRLQADVHSRPISPAATTVNVPDDVTELRYCIQGVDRITGCCGDFAYHEDFPFEAVTPVYAHLPELYQALTAAGWQHVGRLTENRFVRQPSPARPDISPEEARALRFDETAGLMEQLLKGLPIPAGHQAHFDRDYARRWNMRLSGAHGADISPVSSRPADSISSYIRRTPADEADARQYHAEIRVFLDRPRAVLWVDKGIPVKFQAKTLFEGDESFVYADNYKALFAVIEARVTRALHRGFAEDIFARQNGETNGISRNSVGLAPPRLMASECASPSA
ncbi:MAG: hypothetical protein CVV05_00975 [Gammaproteobacteria bacterium HGW-Gammaproteobacteria-1]|jgi:hypothetical protein|nr:MAG: hypothetical protein CVV05_00975 [Gammaproteobacteria bacterium HGW-Gammaproteobacteria-1]